MKKEYILNNFDIIAADEHFLRRVIIFINVKKLDSEHNIYTSFYKNSSDWGLLTPSGLDKGFELNTINYEELALEILNEISEKYGSKLNYDFYIEHRSALSQCYIRTSSGIDLELRYGSITPERLEESLNALLKYLNINSDKIKINIYKNGKVVFKKLPVGAEESIREFFKIIDRVRQLRW